MSGPRTDMTVRYATIPGLKPLDIVRIVAPPDQADPQACGGLAPTNVIRLTLPSQVLGITPEAMPFELHISVSVKVSNAQEFERSVGEYVDKEESAFQQLKSLLRRSNYFPAEAADDAAIPIQQHVSADGAQIPLAQCAAEQWRTCTQFE
jgi:hypothetical protein